MNASASPPTTYSKGFTSSSDPLILWRVTGSWSLSQPLLCERQGTPWPGCQCRVWLHTQHTLQWMWVQHSSHCVAHCPQCAHPCPLSFRAAHMAELLSWLLFASMYMNRMLIQQTRNIWAWSVWALQSMVALKIPKQVLVLSPGWGTAATAGADSFTLASLNDQCLCHHKGPKTPDKKTDLWCDGLSKRYQYLQ